MRVRMPAERMRSYVNVSLDAVVANCRAIQTSTNAEVMAVVKANAFGHGAVPVALTLAGAGVRRFAIASIEEGVELREAGVVGEILLLYGVMPGEERVAREQGLTPSIGDERQLTAWAAEARAAGEQLSCHLQFDTGMSRLGFAAAESPRIAGMVAEHGELRVEGLSTHLASAERFGSEQTAGDQHREYLEVIREVKDRGIEPAVTHIANSAAAAYRGDWAAPLVRPGLALYGYVPEADDSPECGFEVVPALTWRAGVLTVRAVARGAQVGYGGTFRATRDMRVAVVAVGYADGLPLALSNLGSLWFRGHRCPIVGLINMDLTLVDVTDLAEPPKSGEELTLIGPEYDAAAMGADAGTTPYELLTGISSRVERRYGAAS